MIFFKFSLRIDRLLQKLKVDSKLEHLMAFIKIKIISILIIRTLFANLKKSKELFYDERRTDTE